MALVFADLTRKQINWYQALENWEMLESKAVRTWKQLGELKGLVEKGRAYLLEVVRVQLQDPVPETIRLAVEGTNDPAILDRWFKAALRAENLADLLSAMKVNP